MKKAIIYLKNVTKTFSTEAGDFLALKGVSTTVNKGEFVGVVGKSGSGKSTMINMIAGIDRPTSGEIYINDNAIHKLNEGQMAVWRGKNLGIVFQFFQLLPTLTVIENVMLPMEFANTIASNKRHSRAKSLLSQVDVVTQADKFPHQLSGGQQQRVAIARALANDPAIIVADEPTGNLDTQTANAVFDLFKGLTKAGKAILMVTHDVELSKKVDRTIVLSDGMIAG